MKRTGKKVFVGMSGGVDSSVAALLLKQQGYDVTGIFMRCYNVDGCAEQDAEDARRVAEHIGIPFYAWDFEEEYKKKVVEYMVRGYRAGLTPNPDVMCNREIKFGMFLERALRLGADYVATGHYVRLHSSANNESVTNRRKGSGFGNSQKIRYSLISARDANKDQSYFLWTLTQKELERCLFPIGDYVKPQVRRIAKRAGLPTAEKKDSQGICFLGQVTLVDFLKEYLPERKGAVLNAAGKRIGTHAGAHFYTIGQRQGLRHETWNMKHESFRKGDRGRFYVAKKDVRKNTITVAEGAEHESLYRTEVELTDLNFINPTLHASRLPRGEAFRGFTLHVFARVRYRQPLARARLIVRNTRSVRSTESKKQAKRSSNSNKRSDPAIQTARLIFDQPQRFVAEGQSVVFYIKRQGLYEMLGGGVIR